MWRLRLFFLFHLSVAAQRAADGEVAALVRDALAAESRYDAKTALELFLKADAARPNDALVLQKIARQYSDLDFVAADAAEKKRLCTLALDYSKRAVVLEPKNAVNLLSLAICYGKLGTLSDTRTKLEYSRLVKQYAEIVQEEARRLSDMVEEVLLYSETQSGRKKYKLD